MIQKQLNPKKTSNKDLDYSHLIMVEPEDYQNQLRQEIIKSAHKKVKGESIPTQTQKEKYIQKQAELILTQAKEYSEANSTFNSIRDDFINLKQYSDVKMAVIDNVISGSSGDEIQAIIQPVDDVIMIAAGEPEIMQFHIIGKLQTTENIRIQPKIKIIQSFKGAKTPLIQALHKVGQYFIYKLTISSMIRKYTIVAQAEDTELNCGQIAFQSKKDGRLLLQKGFCFNFIIKASSRLSQLEQILIFSVCKDTKIEALKDKITRIRLSKISTQLIDSFCKIQSKNYFYELLLVLLEKTQLSDKKSLTPEIMTVYKLLGRTFMQQNYPPFIDEGQSHLKRQLLVNLVEIILYEVDKELLTKKENHELVKKLFKDIKEEYKDDSFIIILERFNMSQCPLLSEIFNYKELMNDYIRDLCSNIEDQLAAEILASIYYFKIHQKTNRQMPIKIILDGITLFDYKLKIEKTSKYLNLYAPLLFEVISRKNVLKPRDLKPDYLLKLIKLYPLLKSLQTNSHRIPNDIDAEIKQYLNRQASKYIKDEQYFDLILQIFRQLYLNPEISVHFFTQQVVYKQFPKRIQSILTNLRSNDDKFLIKINSMLILQAIRKQVPITGCFKKYEDVIKKKDRRTALRILDSGLTNQFFELQRNEIQFDQILQPIINHYYKDHNIFKQDWNFSFMFNSHINEKILECLINLKKKDLNKLDYSCFLDEIHLIIQTSNNLRNQDRERLQIIVLGEKMEIDVAHIREYLQKQEKLYLKILLNIKNKQSHQKKIEVITALSAIQSEIQRKQYTYDQVCRMLPKTQKDKSRFIRLTTQKTYRNLFEQQQFLKGKLDKIEKVKKCVQCIKLKFPTIPKEEVTKIDDQINQSLRLMKQRPINQLSSIKSFPEFNENLLNLYQFPFFFDKMPNNDIKTINQVTEKSGEKINEIITKFKKFVSGLDKNQISFEEYDYFDLDHLSQIQLEQIIKICYPLILPRNQSIKIIKVVELTKMLEFYREVAISLNYLIKDNKKWKDQLKNNLDLFIKFVLSVQNKQEKRIISIRDIEGNIGSFFQILSKLKIQPTKNQLNELSANLPLENVYGKLESLKSLQKSQISIILCLILITKRLPQLEKLRSIQGSIQFIKEAFIDNTDPNVSLGYSQLSSYKIVMKFFKNSIVPNLLPTGDPLKLIDNINDIIQKDNYKSEELFVRRLLSLTDKTDQFEDCFKKLKDSSHMQTVNIKKLVQNSRVIIGLDNKNQNFSLRIEVQMKENLIEEKQFAQLQKFKDEAYIIKNKASQCQQQEERISIIRKVQVFLKMYELLHKTQQVLRELLDNGYVLFKSEDIVLNIKNQNLQEMQKFYEKMLESSKKWDQSLKQIYGFSYKATMIKGEKFKQLYFLLKSFKSLPYAQFQKMFKQKLGNIQRFRGIVKETNTFKIILSNLSKKTFSKEQNPDTCLELVKYFFKQLKNQTQKVIKPAADRYDNYVDIFRFSEKDKDFFYCLSEMKKQKIQNLEQGQLIACKKDTTKQELDAFLQRSIRDYDNQYFLLNYDNLSQDLQSHMTNKIEESIKKGVNTLKLCLAGTETTNSVFRLFASKNLMNTTNIKSAHEMKADPKVFIEQLKKRINDEKYLGFVRVYTSSYPGLGKTYTIQKQIKKNKHQVIYFPISGRTSSQKLYNRLTEMILPYQDSLYSIIFQLYEIQDQSIDIVNDFIRQIILFRSFQYMSKFCECKKQTRVYLQIQDERIVKLLPFLKLLHEKYNKQIFVNIQKFDLGNIQIKLEDIKLCYILQHLESYDKNILDGMDIPNIINFKPRILGKQLLKKYFVDAYPKQLELTYYQFKYWVDLFYESCASFSGSFQISNLFFKESYTPAIIKNYGLQKLRSQFFRVLLDNSIQFLSFSVQNLMKSTFDQDKNKDNQKKNNLGQIPFFLVPNNQCQWFSFIFKQTSHIPKAIRSYLISQSACLPGNHKKSKQILQKQIFEQQELIKLENQNREQFENRLQIILRDISGMNSYNMKNDPQYVMNIDNFIKFCLISYKMKVNIPILIQGEAGVGKTALLRHLIQEVFQYQFIPHTVNAGVTELDLKKKIQDAYKKYNQIELLNKDKDIKKKVCIFFDQFNTLPQLGYIKEIMMEHRFMGEQKDFFKNLIVFAACNPYRNSKSAAKPKNQADKKQVKQQVANLAFTVKRPPISMGQIMWNFGALSEQQMNKYIIKMLSQIEKDLSGKKFVHLICQIQNGLNSIQFGSANLRDIERFRQLYTWLREKMPLQSKKKITDNTGLSKDYSNLALRAYIVTLNLTYLTRINSKGKQNKINQLISKNPNISLQKIKQYKQFEEDDFCQRLKISFEGISLNSALKENLYSIFICIMKCLPILIIGSPGCSKSLATRIIGDNFKYNAKGGDKWLQNFPRINQFYLQGSQGCKTEIVEKRFLQVKRFMQLQQKNNKNPADRKIPLLVFDEMGLAEKSLDNPLKAIHEPLQLSANTHKNKHKGQRSFSFLGISNNDLDLSKMSRFLILRRPDIGLEDLKKTGRQISKGIFKNTNFNHANIQHYIDTFSQTYEQFLREWKQQEGQKSEAFKNFFGLRDFYNLIRTFGDIIMSQQDKNTLEKIDQICDLAMYRNLNGMPNSYERFRDKFYRKLKKEVPKIEHHVLDETILSLEKKSRRYPLLIVEDNTAQSIFEYNVKKKFENIQFANGSPFPNDLRNSQYIAKCLTQIVQYVKSDKKLIANELNKTAQGALFDLFNKFFIKRDNNEYYRVAMQSGYTTQEIVHPNFNASIILRSDQLSKQSPAFLNRFQKYQFSINDLNIPKLNEMCQKLKKILMEIQEQCNKNELGHYKLEHLFLNYSEKSLRSLIYKQLLQTQKNKQDDKVIIKRCIEALTRVATKDFQFIMKYIFCNSEWKQSDYFKQFEQGLEKKAKSLKQCSTAIIITTDENIWVSSKKNDTTIYLREYKTEKQLSKQITQYMKSQIYKDGTLYIDFTREGGNNLNDKIIFFKGNQTRIEVSYILYLINKCRNEFKKRNQQSFNNKFKIILNYNRINNQSFTEIPYILPCMIFSLDGSSQIQNKQKLFQNTNMRKIIDQCLKSFKFSIDQVEITQPIKKILTDFNSQIAKNEGIFSQCCKDALIILQGDNISINEEDYQGVLKNKQNLKKYNSITTALTKEYFQSKFKAPIVMLLKTLINEKILINYGDKAKESLLSNFIECGSEFNNNIQDKNTEKIKKFMMGMAKKKIQSVKGKYKTLRYDDELDLSDKKFVQAELKLPTFFPYSSTQLQILFDPQFRKKIIDLASDNHKLDVGYTQFEEEYYKKIQNKGFTKELFSLYKQLTRGSNKYWKKMFMADVVTVLLKISKVPTKFTFRIVDQIQNQFVPQYQNKFFKKIIMIIGNFEVWASAFRAFHILAQNSITRLMPKSKGLKSTTIASQLLSFINKMIPFTTGSVRAVRSHKDELNQKLKIYSQIHHSISFQIQNLVNSKLLQKNNNIYMEIAITEQFVTIWETLYEKNPTIDFSQYLKKLGNIKLFFKFSILEQFFNSILGKMNSGIDNIIYEYLANKLYPKWFNFCQNFEDIQIVFNKFYDICERNAFFAHNSTGSIQIALASLDIRFTYGNFSREIQELRATTHRSQIVNLKKKLLMKIGQKCQEKKYQDNLSVLITNMIYMKLVRNNTLIQDPSRGFTKSDLQRGFENFKNFYQQLLQGSNPIFKLLAFSYIKIYLNMYIGIADSVDNTCIEIDKKLCEDNQISKQLRFYCLKILRTKLNAKEISEQYIKIGTYKWCNQFKQAMKQQTSRAIEVPKIPEQFIIKELEQKIQEFKKYQGRDVNFLDDIINLGSQNIGGRYTVLNFFAKYLYSMAYNKQYQAKIIDHVKNKQAQYSAKLGAEEYKLLLRYTLSKFDEKYFVEKHETFDQGQFIILNNINWIYASKAVLSPVHSLFFSNGKLIQSIDKQISQSFVPCGPENPFITTAKVVYNDTRNCNVGVYICCSTCDFIYSHLNCGWPNQKIQCVMCGQDIGGAGGHKLCRVDKGARRLMSPKFIDKSMFYIYNLVGFGQEFWDAQRYYILAQINRMKINKSVKLKPLVNKIRIEQEQILTGYNMTLANNRIGTSTSKVIMLCIQSNLYSLVSLDIIKPNQCQAIFGSNQKAVVLDKLNKNINNLIKQIKEVVSLNSKFYTWMFGIQAQIYKLLINFQKNFDSYVDKLEKQAIAVVKSLQAKIPALNANQYRQLYGDLARVIENGLTVKEFRQIKQKKQMSSRNQFARQVFEEKVQQIVSSYLLEGKLAFVESRFEQQGKMQFPFDVMLTQSKYDPKLFPFSKILKVPSEPITFEKISNKYEIVIRDKYPILDYLFKNSITFNSLKSFKKVVQACNIFLENINMKLTRSYSKSYKLNQFNRQMCVDRVNIPDFMINWKKISTFMGPVQVNCKIFGKMNDDIQSSTPIYDFLLDKELKKNYNGNIIVGIFHNFANLHNETLTILKTRKNQIQKYSKMNLFIEGYKKNPQLLTDEDCIEINQAQIMDKILQASVPSIIYGEDLVYHNFDSCQAYFLHKLKGKCELEPDITKYKSVRFVGEVFCRVSPDTKVTAFGQVRDAVYEQLSQQNKKIIKQWLEDQTQVYKYLVYGQMQLLINKMSDNCDYLKKNDESISTYIESHCSNLTLDHIKNSAIGERSIGEIISIFQVVQSVIRPILKYKKAVPEQFRKQMKGEDIIAIKQLLASLPQQPSEQQLTAQQLCVAIQNYVYRNLLSEFMEEGKAMEEFLYNEGYWPVGYDIFTKNAILNQCQAFVNLPPANLVSLMTLVEQFVRY